jgi:hypothetical protein
MFYFPKLCFCNSLCYGLLIRLFLLDQNLVHCMHDIQFNSVHVIVAFCFSIQVYDQFVVFCSSIFCMISIEQFLCVFLYLLS